jgi:hypothetical protein
MRARGPQRVQRVCLLPEAARVRAPMHVRSQNFMIPNKCRLQQLTCNFDVCFCKLAPTFSAPIPL